MRDRRNRFGGWKAPDIREYLRYTPTLDKEISPLYEADQESLIMGRSGSDQRNFGLKGLMEIGVVTENQSVGKNYFGKRVLLDAQFPHIVFICGKRGSGKSYSLGVLAEELAKSNIGVGTIIVDPIGVFWSMKRENSNSREVEILKKMMMIPKGFDNVKVLAPVGFAHSMTGLIDGSLGVAVADMQAGDWCTVFNVDRFKAQGLLIGDVIDKMQNGYDAIYDEQELEIPPKGNQFSIGDIIQCIETDKNINSKAKGYSLSTRRSMIARFQAAGSWGIFSIEGTRIDEISRPNMVTVIDVSHPKLGEDLRSLVVGIIARKILEARIETSKREEAASMGVEMPGCTPIPVTWLLIDEAHLMVPRSAVTPATQALVDYAKLGRKPGCALVLATQRPSATNDAILSQVDVVMGHNLALEEDMHSLRKKVPAKVPPKLLSSDFIRSMPVGVAVLADQKTQDRALLMQFRPRQSYHSGKAAVPGRETELKETIDSGQPKKLVKKSRDPVLNPTLNIEKLMINIDRNVITDITSDDKSVKLEGKGLSSGPETPKKGADPKVADTEIQPITETAPVVEEVPLEKAEPIPPSSAPEEKATAKEPEKAIAEEPRSVQKAEEVGSLEPEKGTDSSPEEPMPEIGYRILEHDFNIEKGAIYFIKEKEAQISWTLFNTIAFREGFSGTSEGEDEKKQDLGMIASRSHMNKVKKLAQVNLDQIYWLSKTSGKKHLEPSNLEKISFTIQKHLRNNPQGYILLEGLEYLISNNDFNKVMRFVETVHESVVVSNGILLIPFSEGVLDIKELQQLETEMDHIFEAENLEKRIFGNKNEEVQNVEKRVIEASKEDHDDKSLPGDSLTVQNGAQGEKVPSSIDWDGDDNSADDDDDDPEEDNFFGDDDEELGPGEYSSTGGEKIDVGTKVIRRKVSLKLAAEKEIDEKKFKRFSIEKEKKGDNILKPGAMKSLPQYDTPQAENIPSMEPIMDGAGSPGKGPKPWDPGNPGASTSGDKVSWEAPKTSPDRIVRLQSIEPQPPQKNIIDVDFIELKKPLEPTLDIVKIAQKKGPGSGKKGLAKVEKTKTKKPVKAAPKTAKPRKSPAKRKPRKPRTPKPKEPKEVKAPKTDDEELGLDWENPEAKLLLGVEPILDTYKAEYAAQKFLDKTLFGKKKEMVSEVKLVFLPLARFFMRLKGGMVFKKEKRAILYWDPLTGEMVIKYSKGLKRTMGLHDLFDHSPSQMKVLRELSPTFYLTDIELKVKTDLRPQDLKKALNSLEKKGRLIKNQSPDGFYRFKRQMELKIPNRLEKSEADLPYIREMRIGVEILEEKYKIKDFKKVLETFNPDVTILEEDRVHFPYFEISIEGKRGPRFIYLDGISGQEDMVLQSLSGWSSLKKKSQKKTGKGKRRTGKKK